MSRYDDMEDRERICRCADPAACREPMPNYGCRRILGRKGPFEEMLCSDCGAPWGSKECGGCHKWVCVFCRKDHKHEWQDLG
jgi:hypothetical protein